MATYHSLDLTLKRIDASGNAWFAGDQGNKVIELSSSGSILSGTNGYTGGGMNGAVWHCNRPFPKESIWHSCALVDTALIPTNAMISLSKSPKSRLRIAFFSSGTLPAQGE